MRLSRRISGLCVVVSLMLAGCTSDEPKVGSPFDTGVLRVATRNGSTTFYLDRHENPAGPEFALITDYADARGWTVEWNMLDSTAAVLDTLEAGTTNLAAAGLTHLDSRNERFTRGPAHTEITEQLVCHRDHRPMPRKPDEIQDVEVVVTAGSSYVETLDTLTDEHPGITFTEDSERTTEVLLSAVADQEVGCTVADSNIVQVMRRHFPHLEIAMNLSGGLNLGWYSPASADELANDAREWMNSREGDEASGRMERRYYASIDDFDCVDLRALNRRIEQRLPTYIDAFRQAEAQTGMPADLLAALSYQESHWDPKARSPTGVRGMMMLTQATAGEVGVTNRLDPLQSIEGGARYLADRHRRLPETIPEPDRTFLARASYTLGPGPWPGSWARIRIPGVICVRCCHYWRTNAITPVPAMAMPGATNRCTTCSGSATTRTLSARHSKTDR